MLTNPSYDENQVGKLFNKMHAKYVRTGNRPAFVQRYTFPHQMVPTLKGPRAQAELDDQKPRKESMFRRSMSDVVPLIVVDAGSGPSLYKRESVASQMSEGTSELSAGELAVVERENKRRDSLRQLEAFERESKNDDVFTDNVKKDSTTSHRDVTKTEGKTVEFSKVGKVNILEQITEFQEEDEEEESDEELVIAEDAQNLQLQKDQRTFYVQAPGKGSAMNVFALMDSTGTQGSVHAGAVVPASNISAHTSTTADDDVLSQLSMQINRLARKAPDWLQELITKEIALPAPPSKGPAMRRLVHRTGGQASPLFKTRLLSSAS